MPEEKKLVLDLDKLEPGDILLTISSRPLSAIMEHKTGCKYHHAQLYMGDSSYIHSYELGVQADNPMRKLFELEDDAVALRLKGDDQAEVIEKAMMAVRSKIGTQYSLDEAKAVLKQPDIDAIEANRQFCTRLVAQAYAEAGVQLVPNEDYCSAQDLITSEKIEVITSILRQGSKAEIKHAIEGSPELEKQKLIHNAVFEQARELTKQDIQTFAQLEAYIAAHPELDEPLTQIVSDSGYLDMWKMEMAKNPHNYDFEKFAIVYPKAQWPQVILKYMPIAENHLYSYKQQLRVYQALNQKQPLAYYRVHMELLNNLIRQFAQMEKTMEDAGAALLLENK